MSVPSILKGMNRQETFRGETVRGLTVDIRTLQERYWVVYKSLPSTSGDVWSLELSSGSKLLDSFKSRFPLSFNEERERGRESDCPKDNPLHRDDGRSLLPFPSSVARYSNPHRYDESLGTNRVSGREGLEGPS